MEVSGASYLPLVLVENGESLKTLAGVEELGILLYLAEHERRKSGLLRRGEESIEALSIVHYPIVAVRFMNELVLLFDPSRDDETIFEYIELDHDHIEKMISEATASGGETFLYKITELTRVFKDIVNRRAFYKIVRCRARDLISNEKILEELRVILPRPIEKRKNAVDLEPRRVDYESYSKSLEEALLSQAREKAYLLNVEARVKKLVDKFIDDLKEKYGSELKSIDEEISAVRREVEVKVAEYRRSREEKERDIKEKYSMEIKELENRLNSLRDSVDNLKLELSKAKRTGGDTGLVKRKIKNVESQIKDLEKKKRDLENAMKEELDEVRLKYDELVGREENRLRSLEGRRESINRELEHYVRQAEENMSSLSEAIHGLIASFKEFEKNVLGKGIPFAIDDKSVLYIPVCIVVYLEGGKRRTNYITPLRIKKGFRGTTREFFKETREFLISGITSTSSTIDYSKIISENNILDKLSPGEAEVALNTLVNLGLVGRKDVDKTIQVFRDLFSTKR